MKCEQMGGVTHAEVVLQVASNGGILLSLPDSIIITNTESCKQCGIVSTRLLILVV
jgi:hypothetical protein